QARASTRLTCSSDRGRTIQRGTRPSTAALAQAAVSSTKASRPTIATSASWIGRATTLTLVRLDPRARRHTGPRRAEPLAAGRMRGEQLTGIHDPVGVEDAAQPGHEVQIGLAVLEREILGLVETHAVLARDRAAHRDTGVEQRLVRRLRALELLGVPVVVEDERVEVAVARVKDVGDLHAVALGDRAERAHDLGEPGARHHAILKQVRRREAPHRARRLLASFPQERALALVARDS